MSSISIKVDRRSREVILNIPRIEDKYKRSLENALDNIGSLIVQEIRTIMKRKNKTGRMYCIRGQCKRASAPGEAPTVRTGRLRRSSNYNVRNHQEMSIGEKMDYALYLELGTKKMAPRPHIITAIHNKANTTYKYLERVGQQIR